MAIHKRSTKKTLSQQLAIAMIITILVVVSCALIVVYSIMYYSRIATERLVEDNISIIAATVEYNLQSMTNTVNYISLQPDLNNFLQEKDPRQKYDYYIQMNSTLKGAFSINDNIIDIFVIDTENGQPYASATTTALNVLEEIDLESRQIGFIPERNLAYITRTILNPLENSPPMQANGCLVVLLDPAFLTVSSFFARDIGMDVCIMDRNGDIVWSTEEMNIEDLADDALRRTLSADMVLYGLPNTAAFNFIQPATVVSILVACLAGLSCIFLLWFVRIRNIVVPLQRFTSHIERMKHTDKDARINSPAPSFPEMDTLIQEFNDLVETRNRLTEELIEKNTRIYEQDLLNTEAELQYLRNQINPHFLYNTLDCLTGIAAERNQVEIMRISKALSRIFRYSLRGDDNVPLSSELHMIEGYLSIQRVRFGDRLDVIFDIAHETRSMIIPKMILQPITENAIIHGIEDEQRPCRITIQSIVEDEDLVITISNDGAAISQKELEKLRQRLSHPESWPLERRTCHIGLANVNARLRISYGDEYGLEIHSSEKLTSVVIRIPINRDGG